MSWIRAANGGFAVTNPDVLVIGAGIYGLTAAVELHRRGRTVTVADPGPVPHPLAASTDISKVVRMEYGTDAEYMAMVDEAIDGWHEWNDLFGDTLYHETGVTMFSRGEMKPGGFEYESFANLKARGHHPERLRETDLTKRYPAWNGDYWKDGFFHARGGFAESGRVVESLARHARGLGIALDEGQTVDTLTPAQRAGRIESVVTREGRAYSPGHVLVCAGAWVPWIIPELQPVMRATGHPVFHLRPPDPAAFAPPEFVTFTADVSRTGWYGFPVHPREGVVKIANHGAGTQVHPEFGERKVALRDHQALEAMLPETFPALVGAPVAYTRLCLYNDTLDGHLWIDRHPRIANVTVGAGGSGHAFKMGPILGALIADAVEGTPNPRLARFRWRDIDTLGREEARYHGPKADPQT